MLRRNLSFDYPLESLVVMFPDGNRKTFTLVTYSLARGEKGNLSFSFVIWQASWISDLAQKTMYT